MTKNDCRTALNSMSCYVKLSVLAKEFGLSKSTLSMFLKGSAYDYMISDEKINAFVTYVTDTLYNII